VFVVVVVVLVFVLCLSDAHGEGVGVAGVGGHGCHVEAGWRRRIQQRREHFGLRSCLVCTLLLPHMCSMCCVCVVHE